jgi:hypothetical protein
LQRPRPRPSLHCNSIHYWRQPPIRACNCTRGCVARRSPKRAWGNHRSLLVLRGVGLLRATKPTNNQTSRGQGRASVGCAGIKRRSANLVHCGGSRRNRRYLARTLAVFCATIIGNLEEQDQHRHQQQQHTSNSSTAAPAAPAATRLGCATAVSGTSSQAVASMGPLASLACAARDFSSSGLRIQTSPPHTTRTRHWRPQDGADGACVNGGTR